MRIWVAVLLLLLVPLTGCADGGFSAEGDEMRISSPTIQAGEPIPSTYTCDGNEVSPAITFSNLPQGTRTVALIVEDPDAGEETFVHWTVWNVPASGGTASIPEGSVPAGALQGTNSAGTVGYTGPCPPSQDGPHTYDFVGYAIDRSLELDDGADPASVQEALRGHVLAETQMSAIYDR